MIDNSLVFDQVPIVLAQETEIEKIVLIDVPSQIYGEIRKIFVSLFESSGFKDIKINEKIDFNNSKNIERIFEINFNQIIDFVNDIKDLWERKFQKQNKIKIKIEKEIENLKFTFSEGMQLRNLLKIYYNSNYPKKIIEQNKSTKDNIYKIKKILKL